MTIWLVLRVCQLKLQYITVRIRIRTFKFRSSLVRILNGMPSHVTCLKTRLDHFVFHFLLVLLRAQFDSWHHTRRRTHSSRQEFFPGVHFCIRISVVSNDLFIISTEHMYFLAYSNIQQYYIKWSRLVRTIQNPDSFGPFKYLTGPVFRSQLYSEWYENALKKEAKRIKMCPLGLVSQFMLKIWKSSDLLFLRYYKTLKYWVKYFLRVAWR